MVLDADQVEPAALDGLGLADQVGIGVGVRD
jgi:hypothetical protein